MERGWFIVHVQSGWEDKVRGLILQRIASDNLQNKIFQVFIPTEDVIEVKKNKKQIKKRKFSPATFSSTWSSTTRPTGWFATSAA